MLAPGAVRYQQQDMALKFTHLRLTYLGFPLLMGLHYGTQRRRRNARPRIAGAALHRAGDIPARTGYRAEPGKFAARARPGRCLPLERVLLRPL